MARFNKESLTLAREFPKELADKWDLRVYTTVETYSREKFIRWHFGFPKAIIEPTLPLLETTLYWADPHWGEDGDFFIFFAKILTKEGDPFPADKLKSELKFLLRQYNHCLSTLRKWVTK